MNTPIRLLTLLVATGCWSVPALAQDNPPPPPPQEGDRPPQDGPPGGRGDRGPGGPGGPGGGVQEDFALLKQFDKDENGYLTAEERKPAREFLAKEKAEGRGPRQGPGGMGGPGGGRGGRRGGGGFGPGGMLAPAMMADADKDKDAKLTKDEFGGLADTWYDKLDPDKAGKLNEDQFVGKFAEILPPPQEGGGGPGGRRGGAQFMGPVVFATLDADKDGSLTREELKNTFEKWYGEWDADKAGSLNEEALRGGLGKVLPQPNFGGPGGGRGGNRPKATPGPKVSPEEAKAHPDAALYDPNVMRTFFFEFENADWEKELAEFKGTDVDIPAKLTVDGKAYPNVGVSFRGASSYFMIGEGHKRSLNVSMDLANKKQTLQEAKTLNLLNSNGDPTFLHTLIYSHVARQYIPSLRSNLTRVVINGESWGVFVNYEQFNGDFVKTNFDSKKGARWKVPGSPRGRGGLEYLGEDLAAYKKIYEIKSKDEASSWDALIQLCKVLNETPADKLEAALEPILDIEGALKFLALENVFINEDGYWTRASDYNLCIDKKGRFHVVAHDTNETFHVGGGGGPGGPGGFGGPGGGFGPGGPDGGDRPPRAEGDQPGGNRPEGQARRGGGGRGRGIELDPLVAVNDRDKPLLSKLLAVPALREKYLGYVRDIAENWLDWNKIGPMAKEWHTLIAEQVKADTRKLDSYETFERGVEGEAQEGGGERGSLKSFMEQRRKYLLSYQPTEAKAAE